MDLQNGLDAVPCRLRNNWVCVVVAVGDPVDSNIDGEISLSSALCDKKHRSVEQWHYAYDQ